MNTDSSKDYEVILEIGVEGGGIDLLGRQIKPNRWEFWLSTDSMALDENDDEVWRHSQSEVVTTWRKAMFRSRIKAEIEKLVPKLNENELSYWRRYIANQWQRILGDDTNGQ